MNSQVLNEPNSLPRRALGWPQLKNIFSPPKHSVVGLKYVVSKREDQFHGNPVKK